MSTAAGLNVQHMRCAVHTLQLAIADGMKERHTSTAISRLRAVAKEARNSKIHELLKRQAKKTALIDQETRWGSIYLMIQRLVELKPFIKVKLYIIFYEFQLLTCPILFHVFIVYLFFTLYKHKNCHKFLVGVRGGMVGY